MKGGKMCTLYDVNELFNKMALSIVVGRLKVNKESDKLYDNLRKALHADFGIPLTASDPGVSLSLEIPKESGSYKKFRALKTWFDKNFE